MSTEAPNLSTAARSYVRAHMSLLTDLLDTDEFRLVNQSDTHHQIEAMEMMGLAEKVRREKHVEDEWATRGRTIRHVWSLTDKAKAEVRDRLEHMDSLPCGTAHTGFETVEAGETYRCTRCGDEHDRATIAAFLGSD